MPPPAAEPLLAGDAAEAGAPTVGLGDLASVGPPSSTKQPIDDNKGKLIYWRSELGDDRRRPERVLFVVWRGDGLRCNDKPAHAQVERFWIHHLC